MISRRGHSTNLERLQGDVDEAAIRGASATGKSDYVSHSRIGPNHIHQLADRVIHLRERCVLRPLHAANNGSRVLLREKSLGDSNNQPGVQCNGHEQHEEHRTAVLQSPRKGSPVDGEHPVEKALAELVEAAAMSPVPLILQQMRAHHRCRGRDHHGDQDGSGENDRELTE